MDDKILEKFSNRADRLIEVLAFENSKDMEDLIVLIFDAIKKVKNELFTTLDENSTEVQKKLTELTTLEQKLKNLLTENKESVVEMKEMVESLKTEVMSVMPSLNTLTARHNEVEFELAQVNTKVGEGKSELDVEIKKLQEELKGMGTKFDNDIKEARKESASRSTGGVRRVFQPYRDDFSGETNGTKKTFYLSREPLKTDTVQIFGTDFPLILRPEIDFTVTGKKLTLTDAVPSPSSGATLIAHYHA